MPLASLPGNKQGDYYIYSTRVSTNNLFEGPEPGEYSYKVNLPQQIENVIGIELTEWTFPQSLVPPFAFKDTFQITMKDSAAVLPDKTFTITIPNVYYTYVYPSSPPNSYVDALQTILNDAIVDDIDYGDKAVFTVSALTDERTAITLTTIFPGYTDGQIEFDLLFTSIDETLSPYAIMGFSYLDYSSSSQSNISGIQTIQNITGPEPINLNQFRYVNINLQEIKNEFKPFARIYLRNQQGSTTRNNSYAPVRFLQQPIRTLDTLHIDIKLENGESPQSFAAHDLTFNVFALSPENSAPDHVKQIFNLSPAYQYAPI